MQAMPWSLTFDQPGYFGLLLLLPVVWLWARRSLAGLGPGRWWLAIWLRWAVLVAVVMALAEVNLVRRTDRLAVVFAVDRSLSIPTDRLPAVMQYLDRSIHRQRRTARGDIVGVITFGSEAAVELPPWEGEVDLPAAFESKIAPEQTDLAAALRLARAIFPADAAKRIVVLSDGHETQGDALAEARRFSAEGGSIDVVPLARGSTADVVVEHVLAPAAPRASAPFDVRVVLEQTLKTAGPVRGRLLVERLADGEPTTLADQPIEVRPGAQVFTLPERLEAAGFYTYRARFVPEPLSGDATAQNNTATAFAQVSGPARVLLVMEPDRQADFGPLAEVLRQERFQVDIRRTDQLFTSLAELQPYDAVVLADVPRTGDRGADDVTLISDDQVKMLVENTSRLGCGLMLLGGPNSFGAGGWDETPLEEAMPVDFQVQSERVIPSGALMLVIDKSSSMAGEKMNMCRAAAVEAVKVLSRRDYLGVTAFDSAAQPVVRMAKVHNRESVLLRIERLAASGGTNLAPAMSDGMQALRSVEAAAKHMIILTDGQTADGNYTQMATAMARSGITVTTEGLGPDADVRLLGDIARRGGGKFYRAVSPRAIPRIFMREARRVTRPLIYEEELGFNPTLVSDHEVLHGLERGLPALTGFVLTTLKESPLVELALTLPKPSGRTNPLLASWQFGLGRSLVWTSDLGQRWTGAWQSWEGRDKLLVQMVRWVARSQDHDRRFLLTTDVEGARVRLVLTALDPQHGYLNLLEPRASVVAPGLEAIDAEFQQEAPGRYVAEFAAPQRGAYFASVVTGTKGPLLRCGVTVGLNDEFRRQPGSVALLEQLAALVPASGGEPGRVIQLPTDVLARSREKFAPLPLEDPFRHDLPPSGSRQAAWHWLLFWACCVCLGDVFNRRVDWTGLSGEWIRHLGRMRMDTAATQAVDQRLNRLKQRKAAVRDGQARAGSAASFDPQAPLQPNPKAAATSAIDGHPGGDEHAPGLAGAPVATLETGAASSKPAADAPPDDYLARLLRAKRTATPPKRNSDE